MAFYMIMGGKIMNHDFAYLSGKTGRRLDKTLSPRSRVEEKADQSVHSWVIQIMSRDFITLKPENSVQEAVAIFKEKGIHHVPLVKENKLVGIVSDRDIMWLEAMEMGKYTTLEQFMNKVVLACHEDTPIDHLAHVFYNEEVNGMPVINDKSELVGIVTHRDILRWIYID